MNNNGVSTALMPNNNRYGSVLQSNNVRSVISYGTQNVNLGPHSSDRSLTRTAPLPATGGQVARYAVIPRTISTVKIFF